jgi:hypothetical protein
MVCAACALVGTVGLVAADATETKPEWVILRGAEKHVLKAGESEGLSAAITTNVKWVFKQESGTGITVECSGLKFSSEFGEALITGPRGMKSGPLLFEGCKVAAPAGDVKCEVSSTGFANGQIRTQALGFEAEEALEGSTNTPHLKMAPVSTREEIVTIQLKGGECANAGGYEVAGTLVAKIDTSALKKAHRWEFAKNTGTRLTIGGVDSTFTGTGEFTLKSGNEWGDV